MMSWRPLLLLFAPLLASAAVQPLADWAGLTPDPALTWQGRPALAWRDIATQTTVTAQDAPTDWTPYQTFHVAVHSAAATPSTITLVLASEDRASDGSDYYAWTFRTDFTGWRTFDVPVSTLTRTRQPRGLDQLDRIYFSSNWSHDLDPATTLHFGEFVLDTAPIPGLDRPAGELLLNRGFELDANRDGTPDTWGYNRFNTGATLTLDGTVAHSGRAAVRIDGQPGARAGISAGLPDAEVDPAAVYLFSAWIKVDGTTASADGTSARFTSVDAKGNVLRSDYRGIPAGPSDWRRHEWLVTFPAGTVKANLVLFHHGDGTAWWDDVSLLKAAAATAKAPALGALVPDGRPTFQWVAPAGEAVLSVSSDASFAPEATRSWPVTGESFTVPEALPTGRTYWWRVSTTTADGGRTITVLPAVGDQPTAAPSFFAGTWEQSMQPLADRIQPYRELAARLTDFAAREGLWDPFKLLTETIALADAMIRTPPADPAAAKADLDARLAELEYTAPWWRTQFLDEATLFGELNLDLPGLAAVKAAAAKQDWPAAKLALRDYYRGRRTPSYYARYEQPPVRSAAQTTDARAEQYLTHQFPIHSYEQPTYDLGKEFDWHIFPINDVEWPTAIHRHFHWSRLAAAYWKTGNEAYAGEIAQELFDWTKDNPMERWDRNRYRWAWSTLNTTVRIYSSWIDSWMQIRGSQSWTPEAQYVFMTDLREQGRFLMTHAAKTGNWVVAEARGLVELGVMFPEFKESRAWLEEGFRRLRHELDIQVLADGVHIERTPGYHSMVIGVFMEPIRLAMLNQYEVEGAEHFIDRLEKMHEYYLYGQKPNHRMAQIGDAGPMNVDSQMRRGWEIFGRQDMQWAMTNGAEGVKPRYQSYPFSAAGQYVSRSAWGDAGALWSILDWGGAVGHSHDDMGQLCVYAYGQDLLIDTGRYSYARPMRNPFFDTVGHNTVLVDQTTQKRRDPLTSDWVSTPQFDAFRGTTDNSEPLLHDRTMVFRQPSAAGPGYWLVVDRLTGDGRHRLDQRWHSHESLQGKVVGDAVVFSGKEAGQTPSLTIAQLPRPGLQAAVVEGAVSYEWYEKIPVDVAQFTLDGPLPAQFVTVLYPTPAGVEPAKVAVRSLNAVDGLLAVEVTVADRGRSFTDRWLLQDGPPAEVTSGGLTTDAALAGVRLEAGQVTAWWLAHGALLAADGTPLCQAAGPMDAAAATMVGTTVVDTTAAKGLRVLAPGELTVNGQAVTAQPIASTAPPEVLPVPKRPGPPNFAIEPPPPPVEASAVMTMLPADAVAPAGLRVQAEAMAEQGGGAVEVTDAKVGAEGSCFLHWDAAGHWLSWPVNIPREGRYTLWLRACGMSARAHRKLSINGTVPAGGEAIGIPGSGGWSSEQDDWRLYRLDGDDGQPLALDLPAGTVSLRLENVDGESLNLDWLLLAPLPGA